MCPDSLWVSVVSREVTGRLGARPSVTYLERSIDLNRQSPPPMALGNSAIEDEDVPRRGSGKHFRGGHNEKG